jgi:hypothetical protein
MMGVSKPAVSQRDQDHRQHVEQGFVAGLLNHLIFPKIQSPVNAGLFCFKLVSKIGTLTSLNFFSRQGLIRVSTHFSIKEFQVWLSVCKVTLHPGFRWDAGGKRNRASLFRPEVLGDQRRRAAGFTRRRALFRRVGGRRCRLGKGPERRLDFGRERNAARFYEVRDRNRRWAQRGRLRRALHCGRADLHPRHVGPGRWHPPDPVHAGRTPARPGDCLPGPQAHRPRRDYPARPGHAVLQGLSGEEPARLVRGLGSGNQRHPQ